jgi:5-methylcytosine-specific restriction enzyme subunit McrC
LANSACRFVFEQGRTVCEFDELDHNNLPNRIIKATLENLRDAESLSDGNRNSLAGVLRELRGIESADLYPGLFRRIRLHRSNAHYGMLLSICELAYDCLLPEQGDGVQRFKDFVQEHDLMASIYEGFVRNFFAAHAPELGYTSVGAPAVKWVVTFEDASSEDFLPTMLTDVTLASPSRKIIIDCKFYQNALIERFGKEKLHSSNLYQIFAYVKNQRCVAGWEECEGLLLYPTVGSDFTHLYNMAGNRIRAATLDLGRPWTEIRDRLIALIR